MYDNNMEKHIMTLIKTYGSLPVKLVIELFKPDEKYINYLVSKMVRRKMLFYIGENNIGLYQGQKSDEKTIMALWFLSEYIRDIDCMNVYKAAMPFKVGFIMNKQLCKIAVPDEGDDIIFRIIEFKKSEKYILIVPNETCIADFVFLSGYNVIFAVPESSEKNSRPYFKKFMLRQERNKQNE